VPALERRLREAARLGFTRAIVPRPSRGAAPVIPGLEIVAVGSVREAIQAALGAVDGSTRRVVAGRSTSVGDPGEEAAGIGRPVLG
jgi:hypothetical protein